MGKHILMCESDNWIGSIIRSMAVKTDILSPPYTQGVLYLGRTVKSSSLMATVLLQQCLCGE